MSCEKVYQEELKAFPHYQTFVARVKAAVIEMLEVLGIDPLSFSPYLKEIVELVSSLYALKRDLGATFYELVLTALWYVSQRKGLPMINLNRLTYLVRAKLKKRISRGRIILLTNQLKKLSESPSRLQTLRRSVLSAIFRLSMDDEFLAKLARSGIPKENYFLKLQHVCLKVVERIYESEESRSTSVLVALTLYIGNKIVASEYGFKRLLPAKTLERLLGVSQFTILRLYRRILERVRDVLESEF